MKSISQIFFDIVEQSPTALAITCDGESISRLSLQETTNQLAREYQRLGVKYGDFVTIGLPNSIEFFQVCIALWKIGAVPQPVSSKLPEMELKAIIKLANPRLVIGLDISSFSGRTCLAIGYKPATEISSDTLPDIVSPYWKIMSSGGSTGRPKLIVSHIAGEYDLGAPSGLQQKINQTQLVPGPLYHNAPFTFSMEGLFRGHHLIVMPKFNAVKCLSLLDLHKVNWVFLVPTMMQRIWKLGRKARGKADLSALEIMVHTAGPCSAWLKEEWINWIGGARVHEVYGGTEATGATWIVGTEWLLHRGSVGKVIEDYNIKVVDPEGRSVPAGTMGEIFFLPDAGPGSSYHYIGAEAKCIAEGWESLGDMGYLDEDGYLYLGDRIKDLIICGGANIYPAEVEAVIDSHPAVLSCAVTGVPHDDLGQVVHAVVESNNGLTQTALLEYLEDKLVRYKLPRTIDLVDKPVRSDAGKVRRSELVEGART